jgi:hypothetical protein
MTFSFLQHLDDYTVGFGLLKFAGAAQLDVPDWNIKLENSIENFIKLSF